MTRKRVPHDETPTIIEFLTHKGFLNLRISLAQETLLRAIYGMLLLGDEMLDMFRRCTGRTEYVPTNYREVTVVAGARSGKDSRIAVPIALYEAIYGGHLLSPGEVGTVPLIAQNAEATKTAFDYAFGYLAREKGNRLSPYFHNQLRGRLVLTSALEQPMELVCFPCTGASTRGRSIPAAVLDEFGFFKTDSGRALDKQIQEAVRRGMVNFLRTGHPRLVKISTPGIGGQTGELYEDWKRYSEEAKKPAERGAGSADVLVWRAPSTVMNDQLREEDLAAERRKSPLVARREYDAEFIAAAEGAFLELDRIEAAVRSTPAALPPDSRWRYVAYVDASGGGRDEFALGIGHTEDGARVRTDYVEGRARPLGQALELTHVVADYAAILKHYRVATVKGDKYAGDWVAQEFRKHGIAYDAAGKNKAQIYRESKPFFNEDRVEIPDDRELIGQLGGLEERVPRNGKVPSVDHPPGGHDDRAVVVCGVIAELAASMAPAVGGTLESFQAAKVARGEAPVVDPASAALHRELDGYGRGREPQRFWGRQRVGMFR